jgi:hypothetical protein
MQNLLNSAAMPATVETVESIPLPTDSPAAGKRILADVSATDATVQLPASAAEHVKADGIKRAAAKLASKRKQASKPSTTSTAETPSSKPAKPATGKAKADKPDVHDIRGTYAGPSPTFRPHNKKLSPIVTDRIVNTFTDRDGHFLRNVFEKYGLRTHPRLNHDAGNVARAIGLGYMRHVGGPLDSRTETMLAVTERYVRERCKKISATPKAK